MSKSNGTLWNNNCVDCGALKVTHGPELPGRCSKCGGWRWLCHLVNNDKIVDKTFVDFGEVAGNHKIDAKTLSHEAPGGIMTRKRILSQEKQCTSEAVRHNKRGRKPLPTPDKLIRGFDNKGYSSRAMVDELEKRGFQVGYKTIQRLLAGKRQGSLL